MMWLLFYFPLRLELFAEPLTYNASHCIDKIDFQTIIYHQLIENSYDFLTN